MKNYRVHLLRGEPWYKVCLDRGEDHAGIRDWMNRVLPEDEFMYKSVQHRMILMFKTFETYALAKLGLDLVQSEFRGHKVWGEVHKASTESYLLRKHWRNTPERLELEDFRKRFRARMPRITTVTATK